MSSSRPTGVSSLQTVVYQYPDTIGQEVAAGQHYMHIQSYESINSLKNRGDKGIKSSIALYIPAGGLTTQLQQSYEEVDGGAIFAQQGEHILDNFQAAWDAEGADRGAATSKAVSSALETGMGVIGSRFINNLKKGFIRKAGGGFLQAGMGLAVNNHLAIGYKGPTGFRDHTFAFKFFPKKSTESETVKDIIDDFQQGMTPTTLGNFKMGKAQGSAFFKSPRHWKITFYSGTKENKYLHKIKDSVITSMQTNYDPTSMVSFHKDGSPVQIDLSLTFKELSLVISGDEVSDSLESAAKELYNSEMEKRKREEREEKDRQHPKIYTNWGGR